MRLLFVLEDLLMGGAQVHSVDLALRMRRRGMDVQLMVLGRQVAPALAERLGDGLVVLGQQGLHDPREWRRLTAAIDGASGDGVLAVNPVAGCVAAASRLRRARTPLVCVFHSTGVGGMAGWLRIAPFLAAARSSHALVYVSERQRSYWRRRGLGARAVHVIRNGVDLERHRLVDRSAKAVAKAALGVDPSVLTIGSVAMFRREKNHAQMLQGLAGLRAAAVPAQLLLVGDGPTREAAQAQAQAAGLGAQVSFCGEQADVRPFLAAMDVGLLCSTAIETLPLFGLELMACGAPLVASRVGGLEELVEDGVDGLLFPANDTGALVRQLKRCADPVTRARLGEQAAKTAQAFDADAMADRYAALFAQLAVSA